MGFKNVMKKIGKVALTAAPYVAAPFTGGASLALTGVANKAVQKWSEHDAKDAIAHGLAPSSFDRVLGKVGNIASIGSSFIPTNALGAIGMLGKAGKAASVASKAGQAANTVSKLGKAADIANKVTSGIGAAGEIANIARGGPRYQDDYMMDSPSRGGLSGGLGPSNRAVPRNQGAVMPRGGYNYRNNPMNQLDQDNPNLAQSIFQGRQEAIKNQPFRKGYDVTVGLGDPNEKGEYENKRVTRMPKIYETGGGGRNRQQQRAY